MAAIDLTGQRFGKLTVIGLLHGYSVGKDGKHLHAKWSCRCDCGTELAVFATSLTRSNGASKSCGCLKVEVASKRLTTHGLSSSFEYKLLRSAIDRCHNPSSSGYSRWGGRGISVFQEWRDEPEKFVEYIRVHLGERPDGHSLDRIDNQLGYEPGNIKWSSVTEQNRNARSNRRITFNGRTMLLEDWAKFLGVPKSTLHYRLKSWGVEKAMSLSIGDKEVVPKQWCQSSDSNNHKVTKT